MPDVWSELLDIIDRIVAVARHVESIYRAVDAGAPPQQALAEPDQFLLLDARLYALRQLAGLPLPEPLRGPPRRQSSKGLPLIYRLNGSGLECNHWGSCLNIYPAVDWFNSMLALRSEAELRRAETGRPGAGQQGGRPAAAGRPGATRAVNLGTLTATEQAVLDLIRGQAKGVGISGKEILRALKRQGTDLQESTLRRHVLPKLKAVGVINQRAAGGYLCSS